MEASSTKTKTSKNNKKNKSNAMKTKYSSKNITVHSRKKNDSKNKMDTSKHKNRKISATNSVEKSNASSTSIKNKITTVASNRASARLQNKEKLKLSYQTSSSTYTLNSNMNPTIITLPPSINENLLPTSLPREFTEIPGLKRKSKTIPKSECLNFICRGRLLVLNRLKRLHLHRTDKVEHKASHLLDSDTQQIQNYIDNELIKNHYHFSSTMFIENMLSEDFFQQIIDNNSLLINYQHKFYSSEEHATTNLSVTCVFRADTAHASIPPPSGIRAALQVQFEVDYDKGISPPTKPKCEIMPMCHDHDDPLFKHIMEMVEESMDYHLKSPKEVSNFAANDYLN